jgi:acyl carrier protein
MLNKYEDSDEVRDVIIEELQAILSAAGHEPQVIDDDSKLNANLHLSSLDLATLIAVLEDTFDVDPFAEFVAITSMRTVGDLVNAYFGCLSGELQQNYSSELEKAAERAKARK